MSAQESTMPGAPVQTQFLRGLEDVVAGTSAVTEVRGQEGRLLYRGYDIHELARRSTFEETTYLLWNGHLPTRAEIDGLSESLSRNRDLPDAVWDLIGRLPRQADLMDSLRVGVTLLSCVNPDAGDTSPEANRRQAIALTAQMSTLVANLARLKEGKDMVRPKETRSTACSFLQMYLGRDPEEELVRALDMIFVLHADHEFNASTFVGRITASTLADMHAVIAACLAALQGPLHGGANERVKEMLEEIGDPGRAEEFVKDRLARKEKIMGFGHRVYKTEDPRATELRILSRELGERAKDTRLYDISRRVEEVVCREKGLYPNVDFFSASVYHAMGIPKDLYTPLFACSRVAGYAAHAMEQYADNRLIRPRAFYVGPARRPYVPIEKRG